MKLRPYITPDTLHTIAILTLSDEDDEPVEQDVVIQYYYTPGTPARVSGPPEHCYPEEPAEVDMQVFDEDGNCVDHLLSEKEWDRLEQQVINEAVKAREEARADAARDRAEDKLFWKDR